MFINMILNRSVDYDNFPIRNVLEMWRFFKTSLSMEWTFVIKTFGIVNN